MNDVGYEASRGSRHENDISAPKAKVCLAVRDWAGSSPIRPGPE